MRKILTVLNGQNVDNSTRLRQRKTQLNLFLCFFFFFFFFRHTCTLNNTQSFYIVNVIRCCTDCGVGVSNVSWICTFYITKTCPCNIQRIFFSIKNLKFHWKNFDNFNIFCSDIDCGFKLEAVLTSTHNQCFGAKIRKNRYTPACPTFTI